MAIIEALNIHRRFGESDLVAHILKGINIKIEPGEFVAIMGKSGAGKSTLMYQLSVLDTPSEGSVIIDDVDVASLEEHERTSFRLHTLGYIFQNYALVPDLSARENVMLPLLMKNLSWQEAKQVAGTAIDSVGLQGKYENLPAELSGGEQQRVAIARAIAGKPKIIFADEPTANLDSVSGKQVIDLLTELHRSHQHTIVMVTHELEYATNCTRIVDMEDGRIVSDVPN
ncbi:ABC transporter [bacterium]|nr:ABC transporter [bacterium]